MTILPKTRITCRAQRALAVHKTPGSRQPLVAGDGNNVLVIGAATRDELIATRQEALEAMALKLPSPKAPNGAFADSGNSSGALQ
jgi:hypothetical protein